MIEIVNVADLRDPNDPEGRTYRQINAARTHKIPIGTLVELSSGVRMFVVQHTRDCDMEPLYSIGTYPGCPEYERARGYGEEQLTIIRPAPTGDNGDG